MIRRDSQDNIRPFTSENHLVRRPRVLYFPKPAWAFACSFSDTFLALHFRILTQHRRGKSEENSNGAVESSLLLTLWVGWRLMASLKLRRITSSLIPASGTFWESTEWATKVDPALRFQPTISDARASTCGYGPWSTPTFL